MMPPAKMPWQDTELGGERLLDSGQYEKLLICSRKDIPLPEGANCPRALYRERRGKHSVKPEYFYEMIEKCFPRSARCRQSRCQ